MLFNVTGPSWSLIDVERLQEADRTLNSDKRFGLGQCSPFHSYIWGRRWPSSSSPPPLPQVHHHKLSNFCCCGFLIWMQNTGKRSGRPRWCFLRSQTSFATLLMNVTADFTFLQSWRLVSRGRIYGFVRMARKSESLWVTQEPRDLVSRYGPDAVCYWLWMRLSLT